MNPLTLLLFLLPFWGHSQIQHSYILDSLIHAQEGVKEIRISNRKFKRFEINYRYNENKFLVSKAVNMHSEEYNWDYGMLTDSTVFYKDSSLHFSNFTNFPIVTNYVRIKDSNEIHQYYIDYTITNYYREKDSSIQAIHTPMKYSLCKDVVYADSTVDFVSEDYHHEHETIPILFPLDSAHSIQILDEVNHNIIYIYKRKYGIAREMWHLNYEEDQLSSSRMFDKDPISWHFENPLFYYNDEIIHNHKNGKSKLLINYEHEYNLILKYSKKGKLKKIFLSYGAFEYEPVKPHEFRVKRFQHSYKKYRVKYLKK